MSGPVTVLVGSLLRWTDSEIGLLNVLNDYSSSWMASGGDITEKILAEAFSSFPHAVAGPVALAAAGEPASE